MKRITKKVKSKKRVTRKRKNPNVTQLEVRGNTEVDAKPSNDGYYDLIIYYKGEPVIKQKVTRAVAKLATSPKGRDSIYRQVFETLNENNLRKNPKDSKETPKVDDNIMIPTSLGNIALSRSPLEAYRFGYRNGLEEGLNYCGFTDYFKRRDLKSQLQQDLRDAIKKFHRQTEAVGDIAGAKIPKMAG